MQKHNKKKVHNRLERIIREKKTDSDYFFERKTKENEIALLD